MHRSKDDAKHPKTASSSLRAALDSDLAKDT